MTNTIVVDANVLLAALLGGRAKDLFASKSFRFVTTESTVWEATKYTHFIASKLNLAEEQVLQRLPELPILTVHPPSCSL